MATDDRDDRRTVMHTIADGNESLDPAAVTNQLRGELEQIPYPSERGCDLRQEALEALDASDDPLECTLLPKIPGSVSLNDWIQTILL